MAGTLTTTCRRQQSLEALHDAARCDRELAYHPACGGAIDGTRYFVCPTATPLYYTQVYQQLSHQQQLRYNQLTGMSFNELVTLFESDFAARVLAAAANTREVANDPLLRRCLEQFAAEEVQHTKHWVELNRLSDPQRYAHGVYVVTRPPPLARQLMRLVAARPRRFPAIFWVMLALEEKAIDVARRCQHAPREAIEPHYRAIYARHARDEARHVQIDWHLIDRFYASRPSGVRRRSAWLFAQIMGRFFLPPSRAAVRVVQQLVQEFPQLASRQGEIVHQLRSLAGNADYHEMMYSRRGTPITFALLDRFPEMQRMERVMLSYQRQTAGKDDAENDGQPEE